MRHIVSLSGGIASAVAAERTIERHGRENVDLWFANTNWEDEDLYRFMGDCIDRWGGSYIEEGNDGRTPLGVAEEQNIIPNQKLAPCSYQLKQRPFMAYLKATPKPVTVVLGLDWRETHRFAAPRKFYGSIEGVSVEFPLNDPPYFDRYGEVVESWGIAIPRLYTMGFPHNNCGGRCVRQGQTEWLRLRAHFPERFAEMRDWEAKQRASDGKKAEYAFLRDRRNEGLRAMTLAELESRITESPQMPLFADDQFGCFCDV